MPAFHFRLAALLRLRETARDERRTELAESRRADTELERQLMELAQEQGRLQHERREKASPGPIDVPRLADSEKYAVALRARQQDVEERRRTLAVEIDRRRRALIEADQSVKTLEKLRENQILNHRLQEDRCDGRRLDELASQNRSKMHYGT